MAFGFSLAYIVLTLLSPLVLPNPLPYWHIPYILGVISAIACLVQAARSKVFTLPDTYLLIGFLAIATTSSIRAKGGSIGLESLGNILPVILVFFFVQTSVDSIGRMKVLAGALGLVAIFIFLHGLVAYSTGDFQNLYLEPEGVDGNVIYRFRGLGVISDPNDTALLFATIIPLLFIRWKKNALLGNLFLSIFPSLLLVAGIFFTHSRGGMLALAVMLLFAFKEKLGKIKTAILVGCMFAGMLALNLGGGRGMTQDDGDRVGLWGQAMSTFRTHPVLGVGVGNFAEFSDTSLTAHNSYVLCMAETGFFGYFCWLTVIIANWIRLKRTIQPVDPKMLTEGEDDDEKIPYGMRRPEPEPAVANMRQPWTTPALRSAAVTATGTVAMTAASPSRLQPAFPGHGLIQEEQADPEQLKEEYGFVAHKVRAALMATLTASFFLSRTYSVTPYLVLGTIAALWTIRLRTFPEDNFSWGFLFKRGLLIVVGSIVGISIVIRLAGHR